MHKWNTALYDNSHAYVFRFGQEVLEVLKPQSGETILDIGCGTGHLTSCIAQAGAEVIGIDASPDMVREARRLYPQITFVEADATTCSLETVSREQPFDAVFSNAALHWIPRAEAVLECVHDMLKPGGRFVAEFGGKGNVAHIRRAARQALLEILGRDIPDRFYFPSPAEYASLLERYGFRVDALWYFDRPTPLEGSNGIVDWLEMFGGAIFPEIDATVRQQVKHRAQELLRSTPLYNNDSDTWIADYVRLRIVARRLT
ncbi:MAG: methyltransferase domain-containing protein [Bacteroidota bacterium]|nr:methyltransferase domain-containing protein [Candidatus Kapabacteria bacterium]MDW8220049.1 methyltransferase domain-containing protein [Bacteroidota bacterium]